MPDLKHCPRCLRCNEAVFTDNSCAVWVKCDKCGIRTREHLYDRFIPGDYTSAMQEAADDWNRRTERTCSIVGDIMADEMVACDKCGFRYCKIIDASAAWIEPRINYCPGCGAKIEKEDNSDA